MLGHDDGEFLKMLTRVCRRITHTDRYEPPITLLSAFPSVLQQPPTSYGRIGGGVLGTVADHSLWYMLFWLRQLAEISLTGSRRS